MPTNKCDHEENRKKVCAPCGRKIILGKQKLEKFNISSNSLSFIQKVYPNFDLSNAKYPTSICGTCRLALKQNATENKADETKENKIAKSETKITKRRLPIMPNYNDIQLIATTRNTYNVDRICNCYICITARSTVHPNLIKDENLKRKSSVKIDKNNGLYSASQAITSEKSEKSKRIKIDESIMNMKVCTKCLVQIIKGKQHVCSIKIQPVQNAQKLMNNYLSEKHQDEVLGNMLKHKIQVDGDIKNKTYKNTNVSLTTSNGKKIRLIINPTEQKKIMFTEEKLDNFFSNMGPSSRNMKKFVNFLRCGGGKNCVPSYYTNHMSERAKSLQNIYKSGVFEFDVEKNQPKVKRHVVWADAEELLQTVVENRNFVGNYHVKVMADFGKEFLKVSMSVWPEDDSEEDCDDQFQKRSTYAEGGSCSKTAKFTSVKKLLLLCVVPQVKETYENMKLLFELIGINKIPFRFVSDLKLLLILIGQQTATATYPCPYCCISLTDLRNKSNSIKTSDLKTFKNLNDDFQKFCEKNKSKAKAKECNSTINAPLFEEADDLYVIQKCIIPELHILQGFVNHLFWDGLVKLVGLEKALIWPTNLNIIAKDYHGKTFEGNACRRLLKEADKLLDPLIYEKVGQLSIVPYVSAFKAMNRIVENCFSTKTTDVSSLKNEIAYLKKVVSSTDVSITLKMHILLDHLDEGLSFLNEDEGLGLWSEQAGESVHHEFLKIWEKYKINSMNNVIYGEKLKLAVIEFSSIHI